MTPESTPASPLTAAASCCRRTLLSGSKLAIETSEVAAPELGTPRLRELHQARFERSQKPELRRVELAEDESSRALFANVAGFEDLAVLVFFEPPKRQALRAAYVRPVGVDTATLRFVQEGATGRSSGLAAQSLAHGTPDPLGFELEYRQIRRTASGASGPACKGARQPFDDLACQRVHLPVERRDAQQERVTGLGHVLIAAAGGA
jgi:hypothetical protein